jgi:hypothetical protein
MCGRVMGAIGSGFKQSEVQNSKIVDIDGLHSRHFFVNFQAISLMTEKKEEKRQPRSLPGGIEGLCFEICVIGQLDRTPEFRGVKVHAVFSQVLTQHGTIMSRPTSINSYTQRSIMIPICEVYGLVHTIVIEGLIVETDFWRSGNFLPGVQALGY